MIKRKTRPAALVAFTAAMLLSEFTANARSLAPTKPLPTRVQEAEKVFVGVLMNRKLLEGDWCHADLKVTQAIKGVKVGELVPVLWRPKIARYDARENQKGLAVLKYSHKNRYWLRSDTFEDAKLAEQAMKVSGGNEIERGYVQGVTQVNGREDSIQALSVRFKEWGNRMKPPGKAILVSETSGPGSPTRANRRF